VPAADEHAAAEAPLPSPVGSEETAQLLVPLAGLARLGLAVSGGADSLAMMHLAADWARSAPHRPALHVLTVDHRLRAASGAEAAAVSVAAGRLGLAATVLAWGGPKPSSGLAAAARTARYRLLGQAAHDLGLDAVLTAHTLDDQAETLLMRLARGSGLDGLAGIPARATIDGLVVLRPLLGIAHDRLVATLQARGVAWIEDPSNTDDRFERARIRAARPALERLGITGRSLAASARRLARARTAIEAAVDAAMAPAAGIVRLSTFGHAEMDWQRLCGLTEEVRLRVSTRVIELVAAPPEPVSLRRLEALTEARGWGSPAGRTLAGAAFLDAGATATPGSLLVVRELARRPPGRVVLAPGGSIVWDRRFHVTSTAEAPPVEVAALGASGLAAIEGAGFQRPAGLRAHALWAVPACRDDSGGVIAVPTLGFVARGGEGFTCLFPSGGATRHPV